MHQFIGAPSLMYICSQWWILVVIGCDKVPKCFFFFFQVLIDGPKSGVGRKQVNLKYIQLTKFVLPLAQSARSDFFL